MPTDKQIQANRLNSQKSTGPRSVEGKAVSSQNALKSGIDAESQIIRGEDPATLAELTGQYFLDYQPQSAAERALVDILIDNEWTLRRLRRAESHLWDDEFVDTEDYDTRRIPVQPPAGNQQLGNIFRAFRDTFSRLERRRESLQRAFYRALHQLRQLQAARPRPDPPEAAPQAVEHPAPPPVTPSDQKENRGIGFVPEFPPDSPVVAEFPQRAPKREDRPAPATPYVHPNDGAV